MNAATVSQQNIGRSLPSAVAIANLLHGYAEAMDAGDFEAAAAFFEHASIGMAETGAEIDHRQLLSLFRDTVRLYPCGTPRTAHLITNPIIEYDDDAGTATCRSRFTVVQAAPGEPMRPIAGGRYEDSFERVGGAWRFSRRNYAALDLVGDLSKHLTNLPDAKGGPATMGS